MRKYEIAGFSRISKVAARRLYDAGQIVYFCPVNLRPCTPWHCECAQQLNPVDPYTFEQLVNSFTAYNCINSETGKYIAFYVKGV